MSWGWHAAGGPSSSDVGAPSTEAAPGLERLLPSVGPERLTTSLRAVVDPELGVNVVDLGLVYEAEVRAGIARIVMTTTSPACPIGSYLEDAVRWSLLDIPGVVDVEIELTHEPPWSPARMSDAARQALGVPLR